MITLIILTIIGLLGLYSEIFGFRKIQLPLVFAGLTTALVFSILEWNTNQMHFNNMIFIDNFSIAFTGLLLIISIAWFVISTPFFYDPSSKSDHFSLIVFAIIGAVIMTSFNNLIMLFLGIEILSIAMYILAGSNKASLKSNEAALKYFLMGAFATGFLLFGIALVYGYTGSFNLMEIATAISNKDESGLMIYVGIFMILSAMAFKISAVPFHFWSPDVYQGSPTVITAFMSTVVKTAAFASFLRLFYVSFIEIEFIWSDSLWVIAAATILIGNITAVYQTNVKRMLAYSSISHAGYMILAILAMNDFSSGSLLFYTAAYSISSIAAFAILIAVSHTTGSEMIESFYGLGKKNPFLAFATVIAMLSLAGIPPTAGFFAKYYVFSAAIKSEFTVLVLIAISGSLVGVFYYFRIIIALFQEEESPIVKLMSGQKAVLVITSLIALLLGVFPNLVADLL